MKLHYNLVQAVVDGIHTIFFEHRYADKAVEYILHSNPKWGARDRAFIAETIYDMVRWWRLIWAIGEQEPQPQLPILWQAVGWWLSYKGVPLPSWAEWASLDPVALRRRAAAITEPAVLQSVPDWLYALGTEQLGTAAWNSEMAALNQQAPLVVRVNTLKVSRQQLQAQLQQRDIRTYTVPELPDALVFERKINLFALPEFKEGWLEVQDGSSQRVAAFLEPQSGMRVVDACAGAGGKTLHLAALMGNKGRIIALDTEGWKLDELRRRAKRAGASTIETRRIEDAKTIKRLHHTADRLLLDVPCSGLGVLRRNPDTKWKCSEQTIAQVMETQRDILHQYTSILKPGGLLVYATCSILPAENRLQIGHFLDTHPDFSLVRDLPVAAADGFDGFYMALIKKHP